MIFFKTVDIVVNLFRRVLAIIWVILKLPVLLLVFGLTQIVRPMLFIVTVSLATTINIFLKMRYCFVKFLLLGPMLMLSYRDWETDRKSTRLNSSHSAKSRMPSSA